MLSAPELGIYLKARFIMSKSPPIYNLAGLGLEVVGIAGIPVPSSAIFSMFGG